MPFCPEGCNEVFQAGVQVEITTTENVDGGVLVLRPGVYGQVAFGDDDHTGHTVRVEGVEVAPDYGGAHNFSGL